MYSIQVPGSVIADALLSLQQKREHADLRYDIRLFSVGPRFSGYG